MAALKNLTINPVSRVHGELGVHAVLDPSKGEVVDAHSMVSRFRGYEVILKGRDPRDAMDISSRTCGWCGVMHMTAASLATEMAFGLKPSPMAIAVRNLGSAAESAFIQAAHLAAQVAPDFSAAAVAATNPELLLKAKGTLAPHADIHRYRTIADLMEALNPLGSHLRETLIAGRLLLEIVCLLLGKYPHPSTLVPGGVSTKLTLGNFTETYVRILKVVDYCKKIAFLWDDLCDFLLEANPEYRRVGVGPKNFIQMGAWDDIEAYDGTYEHCDEWGERRWATPGVIIDGKLHTTSLREINLGIEEFVERAYYDDWADGPLAMKADPLGKPLSSHHPWNKQTLPRPQAAGSFEGKYTWGTAPRWNRLPMETGPGGRLWVTALAQKQPANDWIIPTGTGIKMLLPKTSLAANLPWGALLPEMELEWKVPDEWNAIERNRAEAYAVTFSGLVAVNCLLKAFEIMRKEGDARLAVEPFDVPRDRRVGVGFWESGRGAITHHMVTEGGHIVNYQIIAPSTWNASPRDPGGKGGPCETALIGTPVLESVKDNWLTGIDILRTVRSFDPCIPCAVH